MKDAKVSAQKPEDFMDEEDLRELEESRTLSTSDSFAGFGSTAEDGMRRQGLMDILRVTDDSVGVRLLKKMGWKEGQGIGPWVRRKANLSSTAESSDETHLFAPNDSQMMSFARKTGHHGLGFIEKGRLQDESGTQFIESSSYAPTGEGQFEQEESVSDMMLGAKNSRNRKTSRTGGFGVGILNDTGSDDEDPYEMGPKISYTKVIGGGKKSGMKKKSHLSSANPLIKIKPTFTPKKDFVTNAGRGFRKCNDGRLPLDGFIFSNELDAFATMTLQDDKLKPPSVPEGWKSSKVPRHNGKESEVLAKASSAKETSLNAQSRAAILGEAQLPGKSVFDFMTPAARARIAAASGKANLPDALSQKPPAGYESTDTERLASLKDLVPRLDPNTARQALQRGTSGWMPYADDEEKRARYRTYLEIHAGTRDALPSRPSSMSKDDWVVEMNEFARAAQVFRPVSGLMASRFTSASSLPTQSTTEDDGSTPTDTLLSKPVKVEDPAEAAARMGMFGPMTRTIQNFRPTRLLCKRFNVTPPEHVQLDPGDGPGGEGQRQASSYGTLPSMAPGAGNEHVGGRSPLQREPSRIAVGDQFSSGGAIEGEAAVVIDAEHNEALEGDRPGQAVFRAVFGDSDDDE
jgi:G patch domain-containing protein 1